MCSINIKEYDLITCACYVRFLHGSTQAHTHMHTAIRPTDDILLDSNQRHIWQSVKRPHSDPEHQHFLCDCYYTANIDSIHASLQFWRQNSSPPASYALHSSPHCLYCISPSNLTSNSPCPFMGTSYLIILFNSLYCTLTLPYPKPPAPLMVTGRLPGPSQHNT